MILKEKFNTAKIFTENVEEACIEQIKNLLNIEAFAGTKIRIMPDCHAGKGCTIGFTMDAKDKIVPNLVGVDIGCGMLTVNLEKTKEEIDFAKLDAVINEFIPSGFNIREKAYGNFAEWVEDVNGNVWGLPCDRVDYVARSIGTLGGGNHFIEIAESEKTKECYLIIHSGSRFLGVHVCKSWQTRAELNFRYEREIPKEIVPDELCWLEGEDLRCYLRDMRVCSDYASLNRETIATEIINNMNWNDSPYLDKFHTVHNYIGDDNIIRKGAIPAKRGEKLLIPLNMRDGSLLCVGKSNPEWNYSAPHGAGRVFSRKQAKKKLSLQRRFKKYSQKHYYSR